MGVSMGVSMVPTFIIEGQHVIVGAENPSGLAMMVAG